MSHETAPSSEPLMVVGEFTANRQTWDQVSTRCELILGGIDGKKLSQKTWVPDDQPDALAKLGITYGLTITLARVGQTEPTVDTIYELTFSGRNYSGVFLFEPYLPEPVATLAGDQPKLVAPDELPAARLAMLNEYLNTYLGD